MVRVRRLCSEYNERLKAIGLRDYQVAYVLDEPAAPGAGAAHLAHAAAAALRRAPRARRALLAAPRLHAHDRRGQGGAGAQGLERQDRGARRARYVEADGLAPPPPRALRGYTIAIGELGGRYLLPPWGLESALLFFFFPFISYGALKAGENFVRVARSLVPLFMTVVRPAYAYTVVEQRAELRLAMQGIVDDAGWIIPREEAALHESSRESPSKRESDEEAVGDLPQSGSVYAMLESLHRDSSSSPPAPASSCASPASRRRSGSSSGGSSGK